MSFPPVPFLQATGGDSEGWEYGRWQFEDRCFRTGGHFHAPKHSIFAVSRDRISLFCSGCANWMVVLLTHGLLKLGVGQSALRLPMGNGVNTWSLHFNDGWEGLSSIFRPFFEQNLQTSINIMSTSFVFPAFRRIPQHSIAFPASGSGETQGLDRSSLRSRT